MKGISKFLPLALVLFLLGVLPIFPANSAQLAQIYSSPYEEPATDGTFTGQGGANPYIDTTSGTAKDFQTTDFSSVSRLAPDAYIPVTGIVPTTGGGTATTGTTGSASGGSSVPTESGGTTTSGSGTFISGGNSAPPLQQYQSGTAVNPVPVSGDLGGGDFQTTEERDANAVRICTDKDTAEQCRSCCTSIYTPIITSCNALDTATERNSCIKNNQKSLDSCSLACTSGGTSTSGSGVATPAAPVTLYITPTTPLTVVTDPTTGRTTTYVRAGDVKNAALTSQTGLVGVQLNVGQVQTAVQVRTAQVSGQSVETRAVSASRLIAAIERGDVQVTAGGQLQAIGARDVAESLGVESAPRISVFGIIRNFLTDLFGTILGGGSGGGAGAGGGTGGTGTGGGLGTPTSPPYEPPAGAGRACSPIGLTCGGTCPSGLVCQSVGTQTRQEFSSGGSGGGDTGVLQNITEAKCECVASATPVPPESGPTCPQNPENFKDSTSATKTAEETKTFTRNSGDGECRNATTEEVIINGPYGPITSRVTKCENEQTPREEREVFVYRVWGQELTDLKNEVSKKACEAAAKAAFAQTDGKLPTCGANDCPNDGVTTNCAACNVASFIEEGDCSVTVKSQPDVSAVPTVYDNLPSSFTFKVTAEATVDYRITAQKACGVANVPSSPVAAGGANQPGGNSGSGGSGSGGGGGGLLSTLKNFLGISSHSQNNNESSIIAVSSPSQPWARNNNAAISADPCPAPWGKTDLGQPLYPFDPNDRSSGPGQLYGGTAPWGKDENGWPLYPIPWDTFCRLTGDNRPSGSTSDGGPSSIPLPSSSGEPAAPSNPSPKDLGTPLDTPVPGNETAVCPAPNNRALDALVQALRDALIVQEQYADPLYGDEDKFEAATDEVNRLTHEINNVVGDNSFGGKEICPQPDTAVCGANKCSPFFNASASTVNCGCPSAAAIEFGSPDSPAPDPTGPDLFSGPGWSGLPLDSQGRRVLGDTCGHDVNQCSASACTATVVDKNNPTQPVSTSGVCAVVSGECICDAISSSEPERTPATPAPSEPGPTTPSTPHTPSPAQPWWYRSGQPETPTTSGSSASTDSCTEFSPDAVAQGLAQLDQLVSSKGTCPSEEQIRSAGALQGLSEIEIDFLIKIEHTFGACAVPDGANELCTSSGLTCTAGVCTVSDNGCACSLPGSSSAPNSGGGGSASSPTSVPSTPTSGLKIGDQCGSAGSPDAQGHVCPANAQCPSNSHCGAPLNSPAGSACTCVSDNAPITTYTPPQAQPETVTEAPTTPTAPSPSQPWRKRPAVPETPTAPQCTYTNQFQVRAYFNANDPWRCGICQSYANDLQNRLYQAGIAGQVVTSGRPYEAASQGVSDPDQPGGCPANTHDAIYVRRIRVGSPKPQCQDEARRWILFCGESTSAVMDRINQLNALP